jgi:hypothetical protein
MKSADIGTTDIGIHKEDHDELMPELTDEEFDSYLNE